MTNLPRLCSLALLLGLTACPADKGKESEGGKTTGDATDTDPVVSGGTSTGTTGTDGQPTSDPTTSTGDPTSTTGTPTSATDTTSPGATESGTTTGGVECQIELPPPGSCDGGKPKGFAPVYAGAPAAGGSVPGPRPLSDGPDEEVFASTTDPGGFIVPQDMGDVMQCDIFGDDCGPGEKCIAFANDGSTSWNATKCSPVDPDPDPIGAPCQAEAGGVGGIDSCVKGSMCWGLDDNGEGVCVENCTCSAENPICTTANTTCTISNQGVLVLCLPVCDPLDVTACGDGEVCISNPAGGLFICVIDASGSEGGVNDPCSFANSCDPGFFCGANDAGACDGAGCCTPFCDLGSPGCPDGQGCVPFFPPDEAPKCFDDVGVCFAQ